jgi:3D (Asp-Asp-Asp) domain-containing protein
VEDGAEATFTTQARTVADVLVERGIHVESGDYVSLDPATPVSEGTRIVVRTAVPVQLRVGGQTRIVRSAAATVGDLLRGEHVELGKSDDVTPPGSSELVANETIDVVRVRTWISHQHVAIAPRVEQRGDTTMVIGKTQTLSNGVPGVRELTYRYTRRDNGPVMRSLLASRIVREPQPRVIIKGLARYASLAKVATQGFESALHFAGTAIHMIATAYTAGCYGCSGITASGVRAGFGVIAVDPSVIPLGTKVFIPGYGRAVAGDTGGAIQGHRVDLGMNTNAEAINFGRRPVTLYILR